MMNQQEKTITVMGYEVNERFAYHMANDVLPVIAETAKALAIQGLGEGDVIRGAEATAKAIASGMRQLVSRRNPSNQNLSGTGPEAQKDLAQEDQRTALLLSELPPGIQLHCQHLTLNYCGANTQKPTE
ncbi:hypothetical protein QQF30_20265 [Lelliottia sp. V104_15]|nr:hypothetical protein [Lelliottia sp. V104_15]MDK9607077.1 hypothetical protein [Lelliottia sp. V104_15]